MDRSSQMYQSFNNTTEHLKKSINQLLFKNSELLKESNQKDFEINNLKGLLNNNNQYLSNNNNGNNNNNNGYYRNSVNPKEMNNNFDGSLDNKKSFMIYGTPAYDEYYENEINDKINNNNRISMNVSNKNINKDQNLKKKGILKNASKLKPRSTSLSNLVWRTDEDDEISSISSKEYNDNNGKDGGYISDSNSITSISTLVNNDKYNDKQYGNERSNNYRIQKAYSYSNYNTNRIYPDTNDQFNNIHHSYSCVNQNNNRQQINGDLRRNSYKNSNNINGYDKNIIKIQSAFRGYKMRKMFSNIKHRKETAIDLLKNEIQYVKKLLCLYKV